MVHSEFELASFPIHLAIDHQTAFTVAQRLNILPLKLRQLDPFSWLSSFEQLQSLSMDGQPNVALSLLLSTFAVLSIVIQFIIIIIIYVINVVVVASFYAILGLVSSINVVRGGALGQSSRFSFVIWDLWNILARSQSRNFNSTTKIFLSAILVINILAGIEQFLGRVVVIGRLSLPLLCHYLLQFLRVHGGNVIVRTIIWKGLCVSYEHLLSFVRVQATSVAMCLVKTGTESFRPFVDDLRLMLIYIQNQRLRNIVFQQEVITATVFLDRESNALSS